MGEETKSAQSSQPLQEQVSLTSVNDEVPTVPSFGNFTLYVGDLDPTVNDGQLHDLFCQVAPVITVRVCRHQTKLNQIGYGYVNFASPEHATIAMEALNYTVVNGRPIRVMHCHRDPSLRKSGKANLFIKNLDSSIDNKSLHDTFTAFGSILSCKVEVDHEGQSKGYGYVQYDEEESAQNAINSLNEKFLNGKQVYVGYHLRRQERNTGSSPKFTNVYVKNLSQSFTDEDLVKTFSPYGSITSAVVMKDESGNSRCFGFVNFQSSDSAASAVESLNDTIHDDKIWFVGRAQKKAEREAELKKKFEQDRINRYEKLQACNMYLKNLDDNMNEEKLKELFSEFGTVTSCKIMIDGHGVSKGYGFVSLSSPEEATKAMKAMNGKMVGSKPLYVAIAQRKEERKSKLQTYFAQVRFQQGTPPEMQPYHHHHHLPMGIPPPQFYYGQAGAPGMLPYGFQPSMMHGIRPGVAPNLMLPFPFQTHVFPPRRFGGRRVGGHSPHFPPHQKANQNGRLNIVKYSANGVGSDQGIVEPASATGDLVATPASVSSMPSLASSLAAAPPDKHREMLGEHLYPLVERIEKDYARKVTGMLLEMDQTEVLHLVESPDALNNKVAEAMTLLRSSPHVDDQHVGFSLVD